MPYQASKLKCVSSALVSEEHRQRCPRVLTSREENHPSRFRRTRPPGQISLLTATVPSPGLCRDQPVAGLDASEPPAASPTEWIAEMIHRDQGDERDGRWGNRILGVDSGGSSTRHLKDLSPVTLVGSDPGDGPLRLLPDDLSQIPPIRFLLHSLRRDSGRKEAPHLIDEILSQGLALS